VHKSNQEIGTTVGSINTAAGQPTEDPMLQTTRAFCRLSPRSKPTKQLRQLELERLFIDFIMEHDRYPGSAELAKALDVTPRTVRTYLRERRERMHGPAKIWVHWYGEDGKPTGSPELLTIEEYAVRAGLSVRQARRRIWEQRRDRIAAIRELHAKDQNVAGGPDTAHKKQMEAIQKDQAAKQQPSRE
jgi:hypothetical protein